MILLGILFDTVTHLKYFCLWHFLAVLWIAILSDNTLNMFVILSGRLFVFDIPWNYVWLQHPTAIILIVVLHGSIRLESHFNFDSSWHFC